MGHIQIKKIKTLRGANIWAYCPVLEIRADIGKYEQLPSDQIEGFADRLLEVMPSLYSHNCSEGKPGGLIERVREGTYMGHILEHIILELQSLAGMPTTFGKTRGAGPEGEYFIVVHYRDEKAAHECVDLGVELLESIAEDKPLNFSLKARLTEIREGAEDRMLGPSTMAIVDAAKYRGIPWMRLDGDGGSLVQLGYGSKAKRIQASESSFTSSIAVDIASNKELTKDLLTRVGVPVPEGAVVSEAEEAWLAAQEIGLPVVVKPFDGNQGKAVSVNLYTEEQVQRAFTLAQQRSERVIVERFMGGGDYRLLVVNGKVVAAAQRRPAQVNCDGVQTIGQLVEHLNSDARRGSGHGAVLTRIKMDEAAELTLSKQGHTWESVPAAGTTVILRDNCNLSTGGTAIDVTDIIHPDNADMAALAASAIGLDIAGVDVVCRDITRPLWEQGGAVVEVNAAPGLRMHVYPSEGESRPVGDAIIDMLFPNDEDGRIPLIAITGTNGKTTVTRMIAQVYSGMGKYIGMTSTDGVYFNGVRRVKADASGPRSAEMVLQHPRVEVAILETARGGILRAGLAWDESDVSLVLNIAGDHMGIDGIDTLEQLARVKRVIVESVARDGYAVLNADDHLVAEMATYSPGDVIFFGKSRKTKRIREHLAEGGKAVYLENGAIVFADGKQGITLMNTVDIPSTHGGLIPFQVQNAMAAAAACWGAGVPVEAIRLGLQTFQADDKAAPGRFNIFDYGKARVVVDYGHNPHAMQAVAGAINAMQPRRAIGVIAAPGDRRDKDIVELAKIAARTFDWVIVREDDDTRGRQRGEVAQLMKKTLLKTCPSLPTCIIEDEMDAVQQSLEMARDGDMVVIFADKVDEVVEEVRQACEAINSIVHEPAWAISFDQAQMSEQVRLHAIAELANQGMFASGSQNPAVKAPLVPATAGRKARTSRPKPRQGISPAHHAPTRTEGFQTS